METETTKYELVIKTNKYAGNFEMELCAHVTGITVGRGEEFQEEDIQELFEDHVDLVYVDGYETSCTIGFYSDSPNVTNNDAIIFFQENPTDEMLEIIKERAGTFKSKYEEIEEDFMHDSVEGLEILGIDLVEKVITTKTNTFKVQ